MQVNVLGNVLWAQGARFCTRRLVGTRAPHKVKKRRNKFLHLRHQAGKENGSTMLPGASRGPILGTWLAGAPHKTAQDPAQDFHKTRTRQDNFASRKHSTRAVNTLNQHEGALLHNNSFGTLTGSSRSRRPSHRAATQTPTFHTLQGVRMK